MTRQEVRDEYKNQEGDPQIKRRIREMGRRIAMSRMFEQLQTADAVITNPTHYAVALGYEQGKMAAPVVLAKGVDHMALKIREIGEAHKVPIVENPPLARTLYAAVDVDEPIKAEHYTAVAQVIGYVMRLKNKAGRRQ
jgi:flagellar biosynthetic protein FlhB